MISGKPDTNRICRVGAVSERTSPRTAPPRYVPQKDRGRTHVSESDQRAVEEHDDTEQHEKRAERGQADLQHRRRANGVSGSSLCVYTVQWSGLASPSRQS